MESDLTEISPFTNNKSVIVEKTKSGVETRICMDTGYTTSSIYKIGGEDVEKYEETTSRLIKELRFTDNILGQYWYPTTAMFKTGVLYPSGAKEDWKWCYAPIIYMDEKERLNYPVPGKEGEFYESRIATDVAEYYPNDDFREACKRVGVAKDIEK